MIIKKKKYKKNIFSSILKKIFNKKSLIILGIFLLIACFLVGLLSGLAVSGFFGSLDNPSQNAIGIIDAIGIKTIARPLIPKIQDVIYTINGIKEENIKIPLNIIKGFFSKPEKIYIDIAFEDYQKIAYKREKSLALGVHLTEDDDYVPGTIRYNDETYKVKLRLKGDLLDHLRSDKWSFRIKIRNSKTLFGMETFSIQTPKARNWLNEIVYQHVLKKEGIITPRTKFLEVVINGKNKGIYELEEHFDKIMIENNLLREGPIIKFNENLRYINKVYSPSIGYNNNAGVYLFTDIDSLQTNKIMKNPVLFNQFDVGKNRIELFRQGKLKTSQVFDSEKLAKYFALSELTGAQHGLFFHNHRFYYNPVTTKLEPTGFDGDAGKEIVDLIFVDDHLWIRELFKDVDFFEAYIKELEKISNKEYVDNIFSELKEENKRNINILHKDNPFYHFSKDVYYNNMEIINKYLNPGKALQAYFYQQKTIIKERTEIKESVIVKVSNVQSMPLVIENVMLEVENQKIELQTEEKQILLPYYPEEFPEYKKLEFIIPKEFEWKDEYAKNMSINFKILGTEKLRSEKIIPWSNLDDNFIEDDIILKESNIEEFEFIEIIENDDDNKKIQIKNGKWDINKDIIIPKGYTVFCNEGTTINLINNAIMLSYSPIIFIGSEEKPIKIISSDSTGEGLVLLNTNNEKNINDKESKSELRHVIFDNLGTPSKKTWQLTGAVTFYESDVEIENCKFLNARSEDGLNIIRSKFEMKNTIIENTFSDAFDIDFGEGILDGIFFMNCGNDCLDTSGSNIEGNNINVVNVGDKGISIGEKSKAVLTNVNVRNAFIGIASKDQSELIINKLSVADSKYGIGIYQKKAEYGSSKIRIENYELENNNQRHITEEGSVLILDDEIINGQEKKVYDILYGVE
jgi:hypothetical protein